MKLLICPSLVKERSHLVEKCHTPQFVFFLYICISLCKDIETRNKTQKKAKLSAIICKIYGKTLRDDLCLEDNELRLFLSQPRHSPNSNVYYHAPDIAAVGTTFNVLPLFRQDSNLSPLQWRAEAIHV